MAHRNIPVFIPHLGCPNQCVFCNQRSISGCRSFQGAESVSRQIETALSTIPDGTDTEIAFFGGSFTGIERSLMVALLETARRFVDTGRVSSIRLSTRPDYISPEILSELSRYPVRHIELGLQSMNDRVLCACRRGHTARQAEDACRAVTEAGFSLTGQMMIGLPEATPESETDTAERICALGATSARIYPTVVFRDTPLCGMTERGEYRPLTAEEAVKRSADALCVFLRNGVPCIRIGLCASEELTSPETVYAGPNHPALGELVWNEYYYRELTAELSRNGLLGADVILRIPAPLVSKTVGQHRSNLTRLFRETGTTVRRIVPEQDDNGIKAVPC